MTKSSWKIDRKIRNEQTEFGMNIFDVDWGMVGSCIFFGVVTWYILYISFGR